MAEDRKVGIIITVKDTASAGFRKMSGAVKGARDALGKLTAGAGQAFATVGKAVVVFNQGLELGRKALDIFNRTVSESVRQALRFRDAGDPAVRFFEDLRREAERTQARVGDALIPVIVGVSKAISEATGSLSEYIAANQKLIGTKVVDFLADTAEFLVNNVGRAVLLVVKVWQGWEIVIDSVRLLVNRFFELTLRGISGLATGFAKVQSFFGNDGLAGAVQGAADAAAGLADEFERSGDDAAASIVKTSGEVENFELTVRKAQGKARDAIRSGVVAAMREVERATKGANRSLEDQAKLLDRVGARTQEVMGGISQELQRKAEFEEADARRFEENQEARLDLLAQEQAAWDATGAAIGSGMGEAFAATLAATENLSEAFEAMAKNLVASVLAAAERVVVARAAEAAAGAASSQAGIPIVGPALAAAAAAAMFGLVRGFLSAFATGGEVKGGRAGTDSVGALLTPGERVLTVDENRQLKSLMHSISSPRPGRQSSGLATFAQGGVVAPMSAQSGVAMMSPAVNVTVQTALPPSSQREGLRIINGLARDFQRAQLDGTLQLESSALRRAVG